jgi:hypothetical protein
MEYSQVLNPTLVGTYPALADAGGGYVWDAVLEYRVWCHPENGSPDLEDGSDYYHAFPTYSEALAFSRSVQKALFRIFFHRMRHPIGWT